MNYFCLQCHNAFYTTLHFPGASSVCSFAPFVPYSASGCKIKWKLLSLSTTVFEQNFLSVRTRSSFFLVVIFALSSFPVFSAHVVSKQFFVTNQASLCKLFRNFLYMLYRVILSVVDPRKCEYIKDYSLDFEHAYMTTYLVS